VEQNLIVSQSNVPTMRVKLAAVFCLLPLWLLSTRPSTSGALFLVVDKSDNTITLYDAVDWIIQWPCTFGSKDLGDKLYQGDRRTPEGKFKIVSKYPHQKWNKFIRIDYPTKADHEKFAERKRQGLIPAHAKIGGDIGIHGTWPHEDWAVELLQPWTLGCISMKNEDVSELYGMIKVGTPIVIRP
jgi:murein L,D-transpeptidase YafK